MVDLMNRRKMIVGLSAFAALCVLPGASKARAEKTIHDFLDMAKTGRVTGATFYLNETIVLQNVTNLLVEDCLFVFDDALKPPDDETPTVAINKLIGWAMSIVDCDGLGFSGCWMGTASSLPVVYKRRIMLKENSNA